MPRLTLPKTFTVGDFSFTMKKYHPKYCNELFDLFKKSTTNSSGVSEGEFDSIEKFQAYIDRSTEKITLHDCDKNDKMFGGLLCYPTPVTRSASPLYSAGYFVLDPEYRGKHLQGEMWDVTDASVIDNGFFGNIGRMALSAKTPFPALRAGWQFTALIPKGLKIAKFGWMTDMIGIQDHRSKMTEQEKQECAAIMNKVRTVPPNQNGFTTSLPADEHVSPVTMTTKLQNKITIKGASKDELKIVEDMIRNCAQNGEGFNVDEFSPSDGHFLHKLLYKPKALLATSGGGSILGAALYGFSLLSRVPGSLMGAYFIVNRTHRRRGVATALLNVVSDLSLKQDCDTLFFDVFVNNHVAIDWLTQQGFIVTGSIPSCGYIADKGFKDSLIMYKQLRPKVKSNL